MQEALLYQKLQNDRISCSLCEHKCKINSGQFGICGMRQNINGILYTHAYGQVIAEHVDPIEKKPLYHFLPGSKTYSIAAPGCNFRCGFCQNWQISQISKRDGFTSGLALTPEQIVQNALKYNCPSISYTYTEPTIFFEYALDSAKLAQKKGLKNIFVTNGFMSAEALQLIAPYLDAANIDLKSFSEDFYKKICHAKLQPVLATIKQMAALKIWVEITTLLIPGENDSPQELKKIAQFIYEVSPEIPWHISAFHPDYQFTDHHLTPLKSLENARNIGLQAGLKSVYLGNV